MTATVDPQTNGQIERLDAIQFLRFAAALLVVILHANIFSNAHFPRPFADPVVMFAELGTAGVPIFFVISGFIMYHTSARNFGKPNAPKAFILRRLARVYPIYWLCLILYIAFRQDMGDLTSTISSLLQVLGSALLLPGLANDIISPAWTLAYEIYFYLAFGLILFLPRTLGIWVISVFFIGSVIIGRSTGMYTWNAVFEQMAKPVLLEFLAGIYIAMIVASPRLRPLWHHEWVAKALFWSGLVGLALVPFVKPYNVPDIIMLGVPATLIVAWAVVREKLGNTPIIVRKLAFLGDSSYSLYLIHILVMSQMQPLLWWFTKRGLTSDVTLIIAMTITSILVSLALHYWLEKPVHRLVRRALLAPERRRAQKAKAL